MATQNRIYVVQFDSGEKMLVRAPNQAQAVRAVVKDRVRSFVPDQEELIALASAGAKVIDSSEPAKPEPTTPAQPAKAA